MEVIRWFTESAIENLSRSETFDFAIDLNASDCYMSIDMSIISCFGFC